MLRRTLVALGAVILLALPTATAQESIEGSWSGTLGGQIELVFNVAATDDGYSSTLDVPVQNLKDHPMASTTFDGTNLRIEFAEVGGVYEGELQEDGTIAGTWVQTAAPNPQPLNLTRQADES